MNRSDTWPSVDIARPPQGAHATIGSRTALVTGAGGAIGRAIAESFARRGYTLVISDLNRELLHDTAAAVEQLGSTVLALECDVTDRKAIEQMLSVTVAARGRLDVLVNNAGLLYPTAVDDITESEWDAVIAVNLKGTFLCSQAALPIMRRNNGGRIVNISSSAGKSVSTVGGAHYTAAKAGILGLTRHLAKSAAPDGVTVNAVCPGLIDTDMVATVVDAHARETYAASFPVSRLGRPDEVAALVAFLGSDEAGYITGASYDINGGDLMI